jgi:hypothetical protein
MSRNDQKYYIVIHAKIAQNKIWSTTNHKLFIPSRDDKYTTNTAKYTTQQRANLQLSGTTPKDLNSDTQRYVCKKQTRDARQWRHL